jgi:hypothetical protein
MYQSEEVGMFYTYVLSYMILYMPTLALVTCFNQMKNPEKNLLILEFSTIGWIIAGLSISYIFIGFYRKCLTGMLKNTFCYLNCGFFLVFLVFLFQNTTKIASTEK